MGSIRFAFTAVAAWASLSLSVAAQDAPLTVVATVGMIADVAAEVGGECVAVEALMGPGVDPHVYQASAGDVGRLQRADIILYSGYSLEGQLGEVLSRFSRSKPTLAVAEAAIEREHLITTDDVYGVDPHLWMDVDLWGATVSAIADALAELRPACRQDMHERATAYAEQLGALHRWVAEAVSSVPDEQRILVTAHDAFSYYGRAYDIQVAGIQGISTEAEAGVADIRETARLIAERRVPAVFVETTINPRTVRAVIEAAARLGHEVEVGAELYSDALGEEGSAGGTYIGMIYENTVNIVDDLGGTLPPLPAELQPWAERWGVGATDAR